MISRPNPCDLEARIEAIERRLQSGDDPTLRQARRTLLELRQAVAVMDATCSAVVSGDLESARNIAVMWRNAQPEEITR